MELLQLLREHDEMELTGSKVFGARVRTLVSRVNDNCDSLVWQEVLNLVQESNTQVIQSQKAPAKKRAAKKPNTPRATTKAKAKTGAKKKAKAKQTAKRKRAESNQALADEATAGVADEEMEAGEIVTPVAKKRSAMKHLPPMPRAIAANGHH